LKNLTSQRPKYPTLPTRANPMRHNPTRLKKFLPGATDWPGYV
jgi:hypothetical protein